MPFRCSSKVLTTHCSLLTTYVLVPCRCSSASAASRSCSRSCSGSRRVHPRRRHESACTPADELARPQDTTRNSLESSDLCVFTRYCALTSAPSASDPRARAALTSAPSASDPRARAFSFRRVTTTAANEMTSLTRRHFRYYGVKYNHSRCLVNLLLCCRQDGTRAVNRICVQCIYTIRRS